MGTPLQQGSPQLRTQPANQGDGKRHKPAQKITEEELRKRIWLYINVIEPVMLKGVPLVWDTFTIEEEGRTRRLVGC